MNESKLLYDRNSMTSRFSRRRRCHGGYVMVLFAMLLFGLMALGALVIDLGIAKHTQRQMQTAVDSAALEGLRFQDHVPPGINDSNLDEARRVQARQIVNFTFDDDFELSADTQQFGAGPLVEFQDGAGDESLYASQFMTIPDERVYKPSGTNELALNRENAIAGDIVAGRYAPLPPQTASPSETRMFHQERNDYTRDDFPDPPTGIASYPALLVRMRRTGESLNSDVGTSGPPLPYLFGRGSLLDRSLVGQGISSRATSMAALQPVVCVGVPDDRANVIGTLRAALSVDEWLRDDFSDLDFSDLLRQTPGMVIGDPVSSELAEVPTESGYISIYQFIQDDEQEQGQDRVIAFGAIRINASGEIEKNLEGDRLRVAHENASAVFSMRIGANDPNPNGLSPLEVRDIIRANRKFSEDHPGLILLAPVSAR